MLMAASSRKTPFFLNDKLEEVHNYGINVESREIFLHGHIGEEDSGVDHVMANNTIKNIRFLSNISEEPIVIHHYNIGGNCDAGFAIYDIIKNCKCNITIVCHGVCASMGTIITQAADERIAMPNCCFLFHEGGTGYEGTHKEAQSFAEYDKVVRRIMVDVYIQEMKNAPYFQGYTNARIKKFLQQKFDSKSDWYITASQALEYGFIDAILDRTKHPYLC